jgi:NADH-quinone oxidoreductase subunit L
VTSLLTAVYMFRLVFLAFHGERRQAAPVSHAAPRSHATAQDPAPGAHLHDAPPAMALALIVLAAGSIVAGYIGFPRALGGSNRFEQFLEPGFGHQAAAAGEHASAATELVLMAVSSMVALGGIALAAFLFLQRKDAAIRLAERFAAVRRLLVHKYYVDEIYDAAVVHPLRKASENALWKTVDARVIDGTVNGAAEIVAAAAVLLRRLQTGSVRAYAASLLFGAVAVVGYYLWR